MRRHSTTGIWSVAAVALLVGQCVSATTLSVNCAQAAGLGSIGVALNQLQTAGVAGPHTITVSGACSENITIQSMDRLTLTTANGASISDASGGTLDVIDVGDSHDVVISGFTINAGAGDVGAGGVACYDGSLCRLANVTIQGASSGAGVLVGALSELRMSTVTLQGNALGLQMITGIRVAASASTIQGNGRGINLANGAQVFITSTTISNNQDFGITAGSNSTVYCIACTITGNPSGGARFLLGGSGRFQSSTITGNGGPGVTVDEVASVVFTGQGSVSGNGGGIDVLCGPSSVYARGIAVSIPDAKTNCAP